MDVAGLIQDLIQGRVAALALLSLKLPLLATASLTLVPAVAPRLPVPVLRIGRSRGLLHSPFFGEPCVLTCAKSGHHLHEIWHGLGFEVTEVPEEGLIISVVLKSSCGLDVVAVNDLVFLFQESVQ